MADRQGIEIDYCPDCRGVWLDRGEVDKIIERATMLRPLLATQHRAKFVAMTVTNMSAQEQ